MTALKNMAQKVEISPPEREIYARKFLPTNIPPSPLLYRNDYTWVKKGARGVQRAIQSPASSQNENFCHRFWVLSFSFFLQHSILPPSVSFHSMLLHYRWNSDSSLRYSKSISLSAIKSKREAMLSNVPEKAEKKVWIMKYEVKCLQTRDEHVTWNIGGGGTGRINLSLEQRRFPTRLENIPAEDTHIKHPIRMRSIGAFISSR